MSIVVIIVNHNAGSELSDLVVSLSSHPDIDSVVVVDNASSDRSLEQLERCCRGNPRLAIVRNAANRGFSAANNQGVALTQGDLVLFINPDCRMNADDLTRLSRFFDSRPDVGMLGVLICNPDGSEQRGCRRYLPDPRRGIMRALHLDRLIRTHKVQGFDLSGTPLPSGPVEVEAISGAFMLVRRDVFMQVGAWDEGYFMHCEDLDLCMRFKRAGWKVLFVPDVSVVHRQGVSSHDKPLFVLWHKHRGMWRFYAKFYRPHAWWALTVAVWCGIWTRFALLAVGVWIRRSWSRLFSPPAG